MKDSDALMRLQAWYGAQCDGEWEHRYGINIQTIDNPGWSVSIDIVGTDAQGVEIARFRSDDFEENDLDWVECGLSEDGTSFGGVGDQSKLAFLVDYFLKHVERGETLSETAGHL